MAYIYFTSEGAAAALAADDTAKSNLNFLVGYTEKSVSDSDYANVKQNLKTATLSGDTITYTDTTISPMNEEGVKSHIQELIDRCNVLLEADPNNGLASTVKTYRNYLEDFDTTTITYPYNGTWEKYCEDNSITYLNFYEIP